MSFCIAIVIEIETRATSRTWPSLRDPDPDPAPRSRADFFDSVIGVRTSRDFCKCEILFVSKAKPYEIEIRTSSATWLSQWTLDRESALQSSADYNEFRYRAWINRDSHRGDGLFVSTANPLEIEIRACTPALGQPGRSRRDRGPPATAREIWSQGSRETTAVFTYAFSIAKCYSLQ